MIESCRVNSKVKAIKYLDGAPDTKGYQKIACKLCAPWIGHQVQRLLQAAQSIHGYEYQGILQPRHYDGMWYKRVGKWLHHRRSITRTMCWD